MENEKYYMPSIEEFCVGFEYQSAQRFMDGTVKTKEDFDNAVWENNVFVNQYDLPYVQRALSGRNAENGFCGIRVKYLDREDIESFGFMFNNESDEFNQVSYSLITEYKVKRGMIKFTHGINDTDSYISAHVVGGIDSTIFLGKIKNKSEFRKTLQQLSII